MASVESPRPLDHASDRTAESFDWAATQALWLTHYAQLRRLAWFLLRREADSHDVVVDVFLRAAPRLNTCADPAAYLRSAVANACRDQLRRGRRRKFIELKPTEASGEPVEIWALLESLPAKQRTALILRYVADMPYSEMAEVMHCRESTARSHVRHGTATLRRMLDEDDLH